MSITENSTAYERCPHAATNPCATTNGSSSSPAVRYCSEDFEDDDDDMSGNEEWTFASVVGARLEDDDGWESGEDLNSSSQLAAFVDDAALVDEVKTLYAKIDEKEALKKALSPLLRGMFSDHPDPYRLLTSFLKRRSKVQCAATLALPRVALAEFNKWMEEQKGLKEMQEPLSQEHRRLALDAFTYSPSCIFNDLCSTFDLMSTDKSELICFVNTLQDIGNNREVAVAIKKFGLQGDIPLQNVVIPLIAQDMINVIEEYLHGERAQQLEFLHLLDTLCIPGELLKAVKKCIGVENKKDNNKLNIPQLYKLGMRLSKLYGIKLETLPNLMHMRNVKRLKQLLHYRYVEHAILDDNFEELVEVAVGDNVKMQQELVFNLMQRKDVKMAAHFAMRYKIPLEKQPHEGKVHLVLHGRRLTTKFGARSDFLDLSLSLTDIVFVDNDESLSSVHEILTKDGATIGIDGEWTLVSPSERLSLLQLAVHNKVFLMDMLKLPKVVSQYKLKTFFASIFNNNKILKLGYQIDGDLHMLLKSCTYMTDVLISPKRVVDLKVLAENVRRDGI